MSPLQSTLDRPQVQDIRVRLDQNFVRRYMGNRLATNEQQQPARIAKRGRRKTIANTTTQPAKIVERRFTRSATAAAAEKAKQSASSGGSTIDLSPSRESFEPPSPLPATQHQQQLQAQTPMKQIVEQSLLPPRRTQHINTNNSRQKLMNVVSLVRPQRLQLKRPNSRQSQVILELVCRQKNKEWMS